MRSNDAANETPVSEENPRECRTALRTEPCTDSRSFATGCTGGGGVGGMVFTLGKVAENPERNDSGIEGMGSLRNRASGVFEAAGVR